MIDIDGQEVCLLFDYQLACPKREVGIKQEESFKKRQSSLRHG